MNTNFNSYFFSVLVGMVIVSLLTGWYVFAFTGPNQAPPGCISGDPGCDAPVNVSDNPQSKTGGFAVNSGNIAAYGFLVPFGNVGIGTLIPGAKLDVAGTVKIGDDLLDVDGDVIYDSALKKIKEDRLPFSKGDILASGDRSLISGLAAYLTDYFSIGNLGIAGTAAANVKDGVIFGPGGGITGSFVGASMIPDADGSFSPVLIKNTTWRALHVPDSVSSIKLNACPVTLASGLATTDKPNSMLSISWVGMVTCGCSSYATGQIDILVDGILIGSGSIFHDGDAGQTQTWWTLEGVHATTNATLTAGTHTITVVGSEPSETDCTRAALDVFGSHVTWQEIEPS